MMRIRITVIAVLIISIYAAPIFAGQPSPAIVTDISDRAYEPAVVELLDGARESIVMSMYIINVRERGPVRLLVRDLEEALARGVSVEIYINTRSGRGIPDSATIDGLLKPVTEKGARVYKVTPDRRLHDKLIIVDSRYVVDGSTNWSVSALKSNYESAVLIESPELAESKLSRLRQLRLEGDKNKPRPPPERPKGLERIPEGAVIGLSKELLDNPRYFPAMLTDRVERAVDTYLLLLAESARRNEREFYVSLEDLAVSRGMNPALSYTRLRKQMTKELKMLQDRYGLIDVDFTFGEDAWVELNQLPGPTFNVAGDFFRYECLQCLSQPAKFVYLIGALLESEGSSLDAFTAEALCKRFPIHKTTMRKGLRELG